MKIIFEKHFVNKSSLGVKRFYKFIFNKFKNTDYLIEEEENYFPYFKSINHIYILVFTWEA